MHVNKKNTIAESLIGSYTPAGGCRNKQKSDNSVSVPLVKLGYVNSVDSLRGVSVSSMGTPACDSQSAVVKKGSLSAGDYARRKIDSKERSGGVSATKQVGVVQTAQQQKAPQARTVALPVASKWYAPAGSAEYIWNWFSGQALSAYISNECRVPSQRVEKQSSATGVSRQLTSKVQAQTAPGFAGVNPLAIVQGGVDAVSGLVASRKGNRWLKSNASVIKGVAGNSTQSSAETVLNRVMDLKLCRSHIKTELDVLVSHQNPIALSWQSKTAGGRVNRVYKANSERSVISAASRQPKAVCSIQPTTPATQSGAVAALSLSSGSSQMIRLYQLVKRIDSSHGSGVSAWPSDQRVNGGQTVNATYNRYYGASLSIPTTYTYTESNVSNALDAVIAANPVSIKEHGLSTMHRASLQQRLPIQASFIAHLLAVKLAAPKNKQSIIQRTGSATVGKNAPTKNIAYVLDMLKAYAQSSRGLLKTPITNDGEQAYVLIGAKISCSGRLQGVEMAKTEWSTFGRIQSNTVDVLKDKGFYVAKTRYGSIGVSVSLSYMARKSVITTGKSRPL